MIPQLEQALCSNNQTFTNILAPAATDTVDLMLAFNRPSPKGFIYNFGDGAGAGVLTVNILCVLPGVSGDIRIPPRGSIDLMGLAVISVTLTNNDVVNIEYQYAAW